MKKLPGADAVTHGFVDLLWPGMLLVEQKSRGKNLDVPAAHQPAARGKSQAQAPGTGRVKVLQRVQADRMK